MNLLCEDNGAQDRDSARCDYSGKHREASNNFSSAKSGGKKDFVAQKHWKINRVCQDFFGVRRCSRNLNT